ncbi:MAG: diguanylate cyclase [Desulfosarcinaceae bacterium]|nr:diguanylate cyclase [Desulfosarcinaceae bacterium]
MAAEFPILIADDDPVTRKLLERTLTKRGYRVTVVDDGRKAFERFQEEFFPLVVSDWMMPGMDGLEICKAIRGVETEGYVFIILLTSRDNREDIVRGLEAGADDYLTKPFNPAELAARINTGIRILELERSLKKANDEIRVLSITDQLTGCYNRVYMVERMEPEIKRAKRYRHWLSVIMCDLDHFKQVNDTHGHQAGDMVLKGFAEIINRSIRDKVDWAVRYGGEEFIIILPETDLEGAAVVAERLRRSAAEARYTAEGTSFHVTASFGVTGLNEKTPWEKLSIDTIIQHADTLLYAAKDAGRDRVHLDQL